MDSVIIPPPDIKEVIESTCSTVRSGGKEVEARIASSERNNPKFSFLNKNDPYHPFYLTVLSTREPEAKPPGHVGVVPEQKRPSFNVQESFTHIVPCNLLSAYDLDVIKLTSLFAAANDPSFISNLLTRELRNSQFDFLKAHHSSHDIYKRLIGSYECILNGAIEQPASFEHLLADIVSLSGLVEYDRPTPNESKPVEDAYDWNNFVIGDVVEFSDDDACILPMHKQSLQSLAVSAKQTVYGIAPTNTRLQPSAPPPVDQYVVCPICKGSINSREFEAHLRLETISNASSLQKRAFAEKFTGSALEESSSSVKRHITGMLGKQRGDVAGQKKTDK